MKSNNYFLSENSQSETHIQRNFTEHLHIFYISAASWKEWDVNPFCNYLFKVTKLGTGTAFFEGKANHFHSHKKTFEGSLRMSIRANPQVPHLKNPITKILKVSVLSYCLPEITQLTFTCSKSRIETLEKGGKYVQS